jgi:hypothetical protein
MVNNSIKPAIAKGIRGRNAMKKISQIYAALRSVAGGCGMVWIAEWLKVVG